MALIGRHQSSTIEEHRKGKERAYLDWSMRTRRRSIRIFFTSFYNIFLDFFLLSLCLIIVLRKRVLLWLFARYVRNITPCVGLSALENSEKSRDFLSETHKIFCNFSLSLQLCCVFQKIVQKWLCFRLAMHLHPSLEELFSYCNEHFKPSLCPMPFSLRPPQRAQSLLLFWSVSSGHLSQGTLLFCIHAIL